MASLLVVALCLGVGRLLRGRVDPGPLNAYVLHVALPALAVVALHDGPPVAWGAVLSVWLVFGAAALFFRGVGRLLGWDAATVGCLTLACGLSNTSFVGFPLLEWLVGPEAIPVAVPLDQLGSFLLVCLAAPIVGAAAAGRGWSARALLGEAARFPAIWAVIAAFVVPAWPEALLGALERIATTLSPVALVAVGAQLRLPDTEARAPFVTGLVYKLALAPLLVWGWARLVGLEGLTERVAVLEAAMAPMVTGAILAQRYGLRPTLAGALLGVGVPVSAVTVWGWSVLLAWMDG